jgi:hypothetical protein
LGLFLLGLQAAEQRGANRSLAARESRARDGGFTTHIAFRRFGRHEGVARVLLESCAMILLRRAWIIPLCALLLVTGCTRVINTSYPPGPVHIVRADAAGHVWVSEPGWFSTLLPSAPKLGHRVASTPYGPMRMKTLSASSHNAFAEIDYLESRASILDTGGMLDAMHDRLAHGRGVRAVADDRLTRGSWDGIALRLLIAPGSDLNPSRDALDMRVLVFVHGHRLLMMFAGGRQGDANAAATALAISDSLRLGG